MRIALEQKQMMKMVMTTELRQAIELLQLSTYELFQFIQQQAEENPFIEFIENHESPYTFESSFRNRTEKSEGNAVEILSRKDKTMHDHLLEQIRWFPISEADYERLHYLILNVNDQGFLTVTNEEIAHTFGMEEQEVLALKKLLHQLEPCGIATCNLRECLSVQALRAFPNDVLLQQIIREFLHELANKQWHAVAKGLNIPLEGVQKAFDQIQTLNPRPASVFSTVKIDYVTPDISIECAEGQGYRVILNDHYIPNMSFNRTLTNGLPQSKEVSDYVNDHLKKFEWLQKSIIQRRNTIMKIMDVLIRHQKDFLQKGFRALKPLTLKDVAAEIKMHESTVSRATANKIVQTPAGTFELRHMFSTKLKTSSGNDTSQSTVKEMIRELVDQEDKYKPLSDQKIADILGERDILISRRTVAKYRDELHIMSSSRRKEIKV